MIIRKMFDIAWDLWEHRNGIVHDGDSAVVLTILREEAKVEMDQARTDDTPELKGLIKIYRKNYQKWDAEALRAWIYRVSTVRALDPGLIQLARQREMMRRIFVPNANNNR